ncbi:CRISPR-associated endonuclease Cas1 [Tepidiforma flava]|uniref:CRISPR-associated endonuclease Cas1 n=1 Tax=Tepidiforma flava TaxID=3004094 RepID=UPI003570A78D
MGLAGATSRPGGMCSRLSAWQRRRRPAPDPSLNALLSYAYALLARPAWQAAAVVGLDPYQGFLHEPARSQPALILDLIEEFRAPIADLLAFDLYRRLRGTPGWWESAPGGAVRLSAETRKLLIARLRIPPAAAHAIPAHADPGAGRPVLRTPGPRPRAAPSSRVRRSGRRGER